MPERLWSLDFVSDQRTDGRRFHVLIVVDDCTRECLTLIANTQLSGARVDLELATLFKVYGKRGNVANYNGTEPTSNAIVIFADDCKIDLPFIAPGKLTQKAFIESFSGRLRRELLKGKLLPSLHLALVTLDV